MAKSLLEILKEEGIELIDSGDRKKAHCPFHKGDNDPSFTVYPNGTYYCFGCQTWGDSLKFLVDYKDMPFKEAMDVLGADYTQPRSEKPSVIKVKNTTKTYKFLYSIVEQYHNFLMETPGAIKYLESRGLTINTIQRYKIGYTDGMVLNLQWAWEHELAIEAGLINRNGFEIFSHRIIFPNPIGDGQCDFIMGRTITNDKIKYLGLRTPKPLFGFFEVRKSPVIFVVEGQVDWLLLRQWGYPAVAISGGKLTRANYLLLSEKKVVIVPDYDPEGQGISTATGIKNALGEAATILDYSELQNPGEKLDIGTLGEWPGGQSLFQIIAQEQLNWLTTNLSKRMLDQYLTPLIDLTQSHLTQKLLV